MLHYFNKFLEIIAANLSKLESSNHLISTIFKKVENTRLVRLENSLYYYEFMKKCKNELPKMTNQRSLSRVVYILIKYNLITVEEVEKYKVIVTKLELRDSSDNLRNDNISRYVRYSTKIESQ